MMAIAEMDALLTAARKRALALRRFPESTYRLQLNSHFTFKDAIAIIPYLADLGVTHVYTSPYLRATPGSTHGYDVIDHNRLNPEFGSDEDYDAFVRALSDHGMSHILDTVPNHVGIGTNENAWWNDVLENGPASPYGNYFDIAWRDSPRPELQDRVLVPILGESYARVLEQGQLTLSFDESAGAFGLSYFDRRFPINPSSYGVILGQLEATTDEAPEFESILTAIGHLPSRSERSADRIRERVRETGMIKHRLAQLCRSSKQVREHVQRRVATLNGEPGNPRSFDALDELLQQQCYRLAYWRIAGEEINYRRFFDINELAALNMEREDVFEATHALTVSLLAQGKIAGLRVDHPDGLYDPAEYFRRLQRHFLAACAHELFVAKNPGNEQQWNELKPEFLGRLEHDESISNDPNLYVVAEKILAVDEHLPRHWAIHGTSGYHFLNMINGLFVDPQNAGAFTATYAKLTGEEMPFDELIDHKQRAILSTSLSSELQMLTHRLGRLAQMCRRSRDFPHRAMADALAEVIASFPVYRTYITGPTVDEVDQRRINAAIVTAKQRQPETDPDLFDFISDVLLQKYPQNLTDAERAEQVAFAGKFQQLTAPVMAKGVEDTAFYIYNRLISLNEVGGDPGVFGIEPAKLHAYLAARQQMWPYGLSALSTHDTKRSEDVRARLNVLSEIPDEWRAHVSRWFTLNTPHRRRIDSAEIPTRNEEYLIYQTLIGAWPLEPCVPEAVSKFIERFQPFIEKAMREAKVNSNWTKPNSAHEKAVHQFVADICNPQIAQEFLDDFRAFQKRIARFGLINSLSQSLLKFTCPGVPDTYQGCELWDFSLVDPDNRRPVDYQSRRQILQQFKLGANELTPASLDDGRAKMWLTRQSLRCRRDHPRLFTEGEYIPLKASGAQADHLFAFARQLDKWVSIVVAPRLVVGASERGWEDTRIELPAGLARKDLRNVFTDQMVDSLRASDLFAQFPVALLLSEGF